MDYEKITNNLLSVGEQYWESFILTLPKLVLAIVVFVIAIFIADKFSQIVHKTASKRVNDELLAKFLARFAKWVLIIAGIIIVFYIVGLGGLAGGLVAGAGLSAIIIGFAFKDIGENFLAGIILAFSRPYDIGDTVESGNVKGTVKALDLRNTHIKTFDGKDVYVPNSMIIKNPLINYTRDGFIREEFVVGIDYDDDIDKAKKIIVDSISNIEGVLGREKLPFVIVEDLGTSTVNLKVFFWVDTFDYKKSMLDIKTDVINATKKSLINNNILMPADILELKIYNEKLPIPIKLLNSEKNFWTSKW